MSDEGPRRRRAPELMIYLDTSALAKLVSREQGSAEMKDFLAKSMGEPLFSSMLSHAELLRAASPHGPRAMEKARQVLSSLQLVDITRELLERAGTLNLGFRVRTLDAIHVVTAGVAQERLSAIVTYDRRMTSAAAALGFTVLAP